MAIEIVSFPMKNGGFFHSFLYVYQAGYQPYHSHGEMFTVGILRLQEHVKVVHPGAGRGSGEADFSPRTIDGVHFFIIE